MGCAITSAVFGGIIIICFAISITQHHYYSWYYDLNYWYNYDAEMAISAITLVLGIVEFAIGIWAAVLSCYITSCSCCVTSPEQVSGYFWFLCFRYSFTLFLDFVTYEHVHMLHDPQPSAICNFLSPYYFSMLWQHLIKLSQANIVSSIVKTSKRQRIRCIYLNKSIYYFEVWHGMHGPISQKA